jgi:1,4-dihydroxy-2-naphthoyl-CoA hydrolase
MQCLIDTPVSASPYPELAELTAAGFQNWIAGYFPGLLGMEVVAVEAARVTARAAVRLDLMGPHGFMHGGTLVSLADSVCGIGTVMNLSDGAHGFVTAQLTSNFLGTIRDGSMFCEATPVHVGRTTQVWDATVSNECTMRPLAVFRCTQIVLSGDC